MSNAPELVLRLGSHSEKDYFEKVIGFLDGFIFGANLLEATPGATSSLVSRFSGAKVRIPYYLDPMTYAFGSYVDPTTGKARTDLDWIKSDQKQHGKLVRTFKRSYRKLAVEFGQPFDEALAQNRALAPSVFPAGNQTVQACRGVLEYQIRRVRAEFESDDETRALADTIPAPSAVFAPYFYIEPSNAKEWTDANLRLARASTSLGLSVPVHAVLCADESFLLDSEFLARIQRELPQTGVGGVWLWFSKLDEDRVPENDREMSTKLLALKMLVEHLSKHLHVYNMHGGYFSLALSKSGLRGISHGVGYGEQKDVVPVVGQTTPMVRYYLPDLHRMLGVPPIERCFSALEIETPPDFHSQVCGCAICRGVVNRDIEQFRLFGEMHRARADSSRDAQTPAAAKRCRYHFLMNRIAERKSVAGSTLTDLVQGLQDAWDKWHPRLPFPAYCNHLQTWQRVLTKQFPLGGLR